MNFLLNTIAMGLTVVSVFISPLTQAKQWHRSLLVTRWLRVMNYHRTLLSSSKRFKILS
jgi:hypothetical protein